MVYIAWRGSKPSDFFTEAVTETYNLELPETYINGFYDLKDSLRKRHGGEAENGTSAASAEVSELHGGRPPREPWIEKLSPQERTLLQNALMQRLVKSIDRLDQVQRDKPGNWKLWRGKLVSERYWASLCDAERLVGEEIDSCLFEADELEPGWRDIFFQQAVQIYRIEKQRERDKKDMKKEVEKQKKQKEKEERRKVVEEREKVEEKIRQERLAEKAMEKLLREEEEMAKKESKVKAKGKAVAAKPKAKKK